MAKRETIITSLKISEAGNEPKKQFGCQITKARKGCSEI